MIGNLKTNCTERNIRDEGADEGELADECTMFAGRCPPHLRSLFNKSKAPPLTANLSRTGASSSEMYQGEGNNITRYRHSRASDVGHRMSALGCENVDRYTLAPEGIIESVSFTFEAEGGCPCHMTLFSVSQSTTTLAATGYNQRRTGLVPPSTCAQCLAPSSDQERHS